MHECTPLEQALIKNLLTEPGTGFASNIYTDGSVIEITFYSMTTMATWAHENREAIVKLSELPEEIYIKVGVRL